MTDPRTPDADRELLEINNLGFFYAIGEEEAKGQWGADVDAGEIFPLVGSPPGNLREHVPGRGGAILTLPGYRSAGDGVWRFNTSTDHGHAWGQTDVGLPLGRKPASQYAGPTHAVGPGHLQAIAMAGAGQDTPLYLSQLWRTTDEKEFRRVPLPWDRMAFGGMAFASDGALLLSEVEVPAGWYCDSVTATDPAGSGGCHPQEPNRVCCPVAPTCSAPSGPWASKLPEGGSSRAPAYGPLRCLRMGTPGTRSVRANRRSPLNAVRAPSVSTHRLAAN